MWRRAVQLYSKFKTFEPLVIAKLVFPCDLVAEVPYHLISGSPDVDAGSVILATDGNRWQLKSG